MPDLSGALDLTIRKALELADAGESSRVRMLSISPPRPITVRKLEQLYEMAFVKIFLGWETFLEASFLRYLCGYQSCNGQETSINGTFFPDLGTAEAALLGRNDFVLWYKPITICRRVNGFLVNSLHHQVISSAQADLESYAAIRHRIVHAQKHAMREFDQATNRLAARRYSGSCAGMFLRDFTSIRGFRMRWIERIGKDFVSLSRQITP